MHFLQFDLLFGTYFLSIHYEIVRRRCVRNNKLTLETQCANRVGPDGLKKESIVEIVDLNSSNFNMGRSSVGDCGITKPSFATVCLAGSFLAKNLYGIGLSQNARFWVLFL